MIALHGKALSAALESPLSRSVWMLAPDSLPKPLRQAKALLVKDFVEPGFDLYVVKSGAELPEVNAPLIQLPPELDHVDVGDVLSLSADGRRIRVIWRERSRQNSILLTERCNHYCLMCSQPPRRVDDEWLLDEAFQLVRMLPVHTSDFGITGGEPTLYGDRLLELLRLTRNLLPNAAVHVLSNGRRFCDPGFADGWAQVDNPNMMVGIPLYGAEPALHDYVVQAQGAFAETVAGILNLGRRRQRIEIRVVIHRQTAPQLVEIADFISRNLTFVDQVALMGLEMIGLARANFPEIWIDPVDYREELTEATLLLAQRRMKVMVYNHQLCLIDRDIWPYAVRSISDWKNEYHSECGGCSVRDACGGFFFSAKYKVSEHIRAIPAAPERPEPGALSLSA